MENNGKNDFIDVYVLKTLNEIKQKVKWAINLEEDKEKETDKKMMFVLKDLINANFKNLQRDPQGNLIYTLLPIVDEKENEKVRLSLVLYYAALYYDNVDLLHDLLRENVSFENNSIIRLEYLDKSISSKFKREDYVIYIKKYGTMFWSFRRSIIGLNEEEREKYIERFVNLFNANYEHISEYIKDKNRDGNLGCLFVKSNLDTFEDETYAAASDKQFELINYVGGNKFNEKTCTRLNNLIQNTDFSNRLCNYDLMMELYTDEELMTLRHDISYFLSNFSKSDEMLQKAIDFLKLSPELVNSAVCLHRNTFMDISNPILVEALSYMRKHYIIVNEHNIGVVSKTVIPKTGVKKILGFYKRRDS